MVAEKIADGKLYLYDILRFYAIKPFSSGYYRLNLRKLKAFAVLREEMIIVSDKIETEHERRLCSSGHAYRKNQIGGVFYGIGIAYSMVEYQKNADFAFFINRKIGLDNFKASDWNEENFL